MRSILSDEVFRLYPFGQQQLVVVELDTVVGNCSARRNRCTMLVPFTRALAWTRISSMQMGVIR